VRLIQVISEYFPPIDDSCGGTQAHLRDLAAALKARGHELEIFTALRGSEFPEHALTAIEWQGIDVMRVTNNFQDVERFEMLYASPHIEARFRAFLWGKKPDLVHFHHLTRLSTTLIDVCAELGIPTVVTLHDFWLVCLRGQRYHPVTHEVCDVLDRERCLACLHPLWPTLLPLDASGAPDAPADPYAQRAGWYTLKRWEQAVKATLARCDLLISPAAFHRDRFVEWGADPARCVVVEHGLDTRFLRAAPRRTRPVQTIGYVGNVIPPKGVHVLVEAFHRLGRADLELQVHGNLNAYHGRTDYAERLRGAPGRAVRLRGAYSYADLPKILAGLDVLVVPSIWWETFGLTAREGALAGVPVVVADVGGLHDVVKSGLALGFRAGDAEDLARVLRRLIEDKALRAEMGRKAHLVRDIADCAAETEAHYETVLSRSAR
jgi:glycosyltransferase involved in cell wall biosynthesis